MNSGESAVRLTRPFHAPQDSENGRHLRASRLIGPVAELARRCYWTEINSTSKSSVELPGIDA